MAKEFNDKDFRKTYEVFYNNTKDALLPVLKKIDTILTNFFATPRKPTSIIDLGQKILKILDEFECNSSLCKQEKCNKNFCKSNILGCIIYSAYQLGLEKNIEKLIRQPFI